MRNFLFLLIALIPSFAIAQDPMQMQAMMKLGEATSMKWNLVNGVITDDAVLIFQVPSAKSAAIAAYDAYRNKHGGAGNAQVDAMLLMANDYYNSGNTAMEVGNAVFSVGDEINLSIAQARYDVGDYPLCITRADMAKDNFASAGESFNTAKTKYLTARFTYNNIIMMLQTLP